MPLKDWCLVLVSIFNMRKLNQLTFVVCCFTCLLFNSLMAQDVSSSRFNKAERIVKRIIRKRKVPGLAITVSKYRKVVWSKGFGFADINNNIPVNPDSTIFRIASISKPIAAIALLKAVEEGLINLDSSLYNYVPYFPRKEYDITIKQLGTHTSGIRGYKGSEFKNNKSLNIREGVAFFEADTLLFKPGTNNTYTSYNWNLISLAIQEEARLPFEDFVKLRVLKPFKMEKTVADTNQPVEGKAVFYRKEGRKFLPVDEVNNYFKLASGGYLATSRDINTFGNALLNDSLIRPNQLKPFVTAQHIDDGLSTSTYYGIGFQVSYDSGGRPCFGHIGNGLGGYGIFYVYPKHGVVLSVLVNTSNPKIDGMFDKLIDKVFDTLQIND